MFDLGNYDFPEYRSECNSMASFSSGTGSKKRRGSFISDSNDDDGDSLKIPRTAGDWNKRSPNRQNHSEIEKRRRDKMNTYIMELSSIIPVCTSRKLDKLTVLRMAVQHMKMLRGSLNSYTEGHYKPAFLSDDELKNLILQAADGFLFVVGCDRGRILYVSESVYQTLHYTQSELLGTSWFDILHPKDLTKVKEQLSCSDISRRERLVDAKTLLPVKTDVPQGLTRLCPGSRRAFFCRMRCKSAPVMKEEADSSTGCQKKKSKSQNSDKKYSVIHFTGYLKSWAPTKDPLEEDSESDSDSCNLSCLVAVGRVHPPLLASSTRETSRLGRAAPTEPIEFISKHTNDGKFVFIDQKASLLLGWLPQELLGSSMYEYFHQDDIPFLAETHRATLQSTESCSTQVYRFRTKEGSFVRLQSSWRTFKNPWTKEIEYIISKNSVVTSEAGLVESTMANESVSQSYNSFNEFLSSPDTNHLQDASPVGGAGSSNSSSRLVGGGIQAGKIGRQIADEVLDNQRRNDSASNSPVSPFEGILGSGASDRSFAALLRSDLTAHRNNVKNNQLLSSNTSNSSSSDTSRSTQTGSKSHRNAAQSSERRGSFNHNNNHTQPVSNENDLMDVVGSRDIEADGTSDSDEAAMAVIMSLLEADAGLGGPVDFSHLPWPLP
ncbi:protein cycle isoform X5 [Penaeus vannamei]|uniref:protein cycle isoform X5 n=1 Tax=Penaeus vannamei TaxID=6689 RepID=UPI000F676BE9|nr:protein cycle-like isoform X3 [Penaeus vannamei]XP_047491276.1 protein cycle-like isoform X1 [Penaeus chinensis]